MQTMADWLSHYSRLAFINTGMGDVDAYRVCARRFASERRWEYEGLPGDSGLFDRLVTGDWNDDFLVVSPGRTVEPTYGPDIIRSA